MSQVDHGSEASAEARFCYITLYVIHDCNTSLSYIIKHISYVVGLYCILHITDYILYNVYHTLYLISRILRILLLYRDIIIYRILLRR